MSFHEPTIASDRDFDGSLAGGGGNSAALDADLLPEEFPDDRPLAARDYGITEAEQGRRESLDRRLRREEPDAALLDLEDEAADSDDESPELVGDDEDGSSDMVKELVALRALADRHADDSGQPRSPRSAEEDAIHVVDADPALADD